MNHIERGMEPLDAVIRQANSFPKEVVVVWLNDGDLEGYSFYDKMHFTLQDADWLKAKTHIINADIAMVYASMLDRPCNLVSLRKLLKRWRILK